MNVEKFNADFNQLVKDAIEGGVPLENIILSLDLKHVDVVLMRKHIRAQQIAAETASKIIPASALPKN